MDECLPVRCSLGWEVWRVGGSEPEASFTLWDRADRYGRETFGAGWYEVRISPQRHRDTEETMDRAAGVLEVGRTEAHEVVINHPDLKPDENGVGHIVFSPTQARNLADLLIKHAAVADAEACRVSCGRMQEITGLLTREERFAATVYALNTLLVQKGILSGEERDAQFLDWAEAQLKKPETERMGTPGALVIAVGKLARRATV